MNFKAEGLQTSAFLYDGCIATGTPVDFIEIEKREAFTMMKVFTSIAFLMCALSAEASAGITDLYVTDLEGTVYYIDGNTLQATELFTVENTYAINDIAYAGENSLLYNSGHSIVERNIQTGLETTLIDFTEHYNGIFHTPGLAISPEGNLVCNIVQFGPGGTVASMVTVDRNTLIPTAVAIDEYIGFFDHHALGNDIFLGATYTSGDILFTNSMTGEIVDQFTTDIDIVSFYESSQGIFAMTLNGELHSVDLQSRSLSYYGQITGTQGNLIGATVPSPTTIACVGVMSLAGSRRRR